MTCICQTYVVHNRLTHHKPHTMKFESEFDPDPIRRKFKTITSIQEIPEDMIKRIGICYEGMLSNLKIIQKTVQKQKKEGHPSEFTESEDTIVRYIALIQTQMSDLQGETEQIWRAVVDLTTVVHELIERLEKHGLA